MKKVVLTLIILPLSLVTGLSQVGIGTTTPSPRAAMEISSTSNGGNTYGGFIPPRVATIMQRNAINPGFTDFGMLVFVETLGCLQLWDGDSWEDIFCVQVATPEIWINEIHYDNMGTDVQEGFEIAGIAGTDLSEYEVVRYDGTSGTTYGATLNLSGVIPDQGLGNGTLGFLLPTNGLQNDLDGIALIKVSSGNIIQFLSYEGSFVATNGPAAGMASLDIGVTESNASTPNGTSMQLTGTGSEYVDFAWTTGSTASFGSINVGQVIN